MALDSHQIKVPSKIPSHVGRRNYFDTFARRSLTISTHTLESPEEVANYLQHLRSKALLSEAEKVCTLIARYLMMSKQFLSGTQLIVCQLSGGKKSTTKAKFEKIWKTARDNARKFLSEESVEDDDEEEESEIDDVWDDIPRMEYENAAFVLEEMKQKAKQYLTQMFAIAEKGLSTGTNEELSEVDRGSILEIVGVPHFDNECEEQESEFSKILVRKDLFFVTQSGENAR